MSHMCVKNIWIFCVSSIIGFKYEKKNLRFFQRIYKIYFFFWKTENKPPTFKEIKPNIYCKGKDYKNYNLDITNQIKKEASAVKSIGGKIINKIPVNDVSNEHHSILKNYFNAANDFHFQFNQYI